MATDPNWVFENYEEAAKLIDNLQAKISSPVSAPAVPADVQAALATLNRLGYTFCGGKEWKPPLGETPDFNLLDKKNERIANLEARNKELQADADRYRWLRNKSSFVNANAPCVWMTKSNGDVMIDESIEMNRSGNSFDAAIDAARGVKDER